MEPGRNLLSQETSPYLLQHAGNPVHWRPWSAEALAEAKRRDCPILLSIGYAACHWCHVMAHESFEDAETARLMNELFVNIKVDREERPDIDHIYMTALHAHGPAGRLAAHHVSHARRPADVRRHLLAARAALGPARRSGRFSSRSIPPGARSAMRWSGAASRSPTIWRSCRTERRPRRHARRPHPGRRRAAERRRSRFTAALRGAPKFPNAPIFRFFWNEMFRRRDPRFGEAVRAMLEAMNAGGIYDHLGGGYARYSTDAEWLVPHFEKMLYDNAQILELLALVHALWPDPAFAERAHETVGWLMREMRVGDAFAASLDADQDGEEGLFYVWREEEIDAALGEAAAPFKAAYDVTPRRQLGRPHGLAPHHAARLAGGGGGPCRLAREALRAAREPPEARPRRQGAGRLERPDDRRARPRQRRLRRAGMARNRARRVRLRHGEAARRRRAAPACLA